ncbi:MAG: formylglycine-generating enzyme family protein, partial [Elusimicrobiales bacterium]|nr:formylglycine-generating enzyme family protein [Elusimicrobiales bacterium]
SEQGRDGDEGPVHEVCVDGFAIGKYEVTVGEFRRFVESSGYQTEAEQGDGCYVAENGKWKKKKGKSWRDPNFSQGDKEPAVCLSWNDSQAYIEWLNRQSGKRYRLPTEAEWEYAARGGTSTARYWGGNPDQACGYANVHDQTSKRVNGFGWENHNCDDGYAATSPVGSFKPNGFGLYDMLGNVWEWNQDWFGSGYYGSSPRNNPTGPSSGSGRVLRGGSWGSNPRYARAAYRDRNTPGNRSGGL